LIRNKQLLAGKLISQQEYDQAASMLQANLATVELRKRLWQDARIYAPFSGIVGARSISPGQVISKNTTFTWLVDLDTVKAEFNVPERFLGEVKTGQAIELKVAAFPKDKFKGEVYFLAPQVDPATRTLLMKARIPNTDHKLKPGMFANLDLTLTLRDEAVLVPESALMTTGDRTAFTLIASRWHSTDAAGQSGLRYCPGQNRNRKRSSSRKEKVVAEGVQKYGLAGP
jgi:membrane fusion protein (multidrug efflux system)